MSVSTEPKKRRAWLAALLSLLLPGLGQLYNRQVRLALALIILFFLLSIPTRWLIAAVPADVVVPVNAVVWFVAIASFLFAIVQAASNARRAKAVFLAWYNRWYVYIGVIVVMTVCDSVLELVPVPSIDAYNSPSGSMSPTLAEGDYFQTRTMAFVGRLPERGEIAVFRPTSDPEVDSIKRIIGLPGDRIQVRDGRIYINGVMVERVELSRDKAALLAQHDPSDRLYRETLPGGFSHPISEVDDTGPFDNTPEFVVPPEHVFVLGDNRDRSNDSRGSLEIHPALRPARQTAVHLLVGRQIAHRQGAGVGSLSGNQLTKRRGRPSISQRDIRDLCMAKSTVFTTNKSQAVRLPKPVALPDNVKQVEITKIGRSRLISPVGHSWDAFFDAGGTGDFPDRKQLKPEKREPL